MQRLGSLPNATFDGYATAALQGLLAGPYSHPDAYQLVTNAELAEQAYAIARAMAAERAKSEAR